LLKFPLSINSESILGEKDFIKLSSLVYDKCGIKLPPAKKTMLETRLRKRLKALSINSFNEYSEFLFSERGIQEELIQMIDVVTTNKTDFFREPAQFSFLTETALPDLLNNLGSNRLLKIWSAGCSTGEEPYTISMVLNEFKLSQYGYEYSVLATDISTKVLNAAMLGIYEIEKVEIIPYELKKKYLLKGKDSKQNLVRIVPQIRNKILFKRINFMDNDLGIKEKQHIIFCRNVIIYFDEETQARVIKKLLNLLVPGGYLFLGHSETIFKTDVLIEQLAPSTYRKL
jgi:chemotaxis protein methyltransferase CheR